MFSRNLSKETKFFRAKNQKVLPGIFQSFFNLRPIWNECYSYRTVNSHIRVTFILDRSLCPELVLARMSRVSGTCEISEYHVWHPWIWVSKHYWYPQILRLRALICRTGGTYNFKFLTQALCPNFIIITRVRLQRAAGELHPVNHVRFLYISRVLGHLS